MSHTLLILKIYTTFKDVQMIFWYLYWFQIFKDQCGSVPSIPVAVRPCIREHSTLERKKRDKNACDFSILNHFYWHIFFLLFYRRRTIPTILGSRPFLKSATIAVRTCWPCKSSSFSSTYSRTTALTFICFPTKWLPPCQGYVTKNNRYILDYLTYLQGRVSHIEMCESK